MHIHTRAQLVKLYQKLAACSLHWFGPIWKWFNRIPNQPTHNMSSKPSWPRFLFVFSLAQSEERERDREIERPRWADKFSRIAVVCCLRENRTDEQHSSTFSGGGCGGGSPCVRCGFVVVVRMFVAQFMVDGCTNHERMCVCVCVVYSCGTLLVCWKLKCTHACFGGAVSSCVLSPRVLALALQFRAVCSARPTFAQQSERARACARSHRKFLSNSTHAMTQRGCGRPHRKYITPSNDVHMCAAAAEAAAADTAGKQPTQTVHNFRFNIFGT